MTGTAPAPQGISRLLAASGFQRSSKVGGEKVGWSGTITRSPRRTLAGFQVQAEDGAVVVRHIVEAVHSIDAAAEQQIRMLRCYGDAITAAGHDGVIRFDPARYRLIVTADSPEGSTS